VGLDEEDDVWATLDGSDNNDQREEAWACIGEKNYENCSLEKFEDQLYRLWDLVEKNEHQEFIRLRDEIIKDAKTFTVRKTSILD
jgi:hypothetical protein